MSDYRGMHTGAIVREEMNVAINAFLTLYNEIHRDDGLHLEYSAVFGHCAHSTDWSDDEGLLPLGNRVLFIALFVYNSTNGLVDLLESDEEDEEVYDDDITLVSESDSDSDSNTYIESRLSIHTLTLVPSSDDDDQSTYDSSDSDNFRSVATHFSDLD
ncbi:unnamed protein product [Cunninghamella echinulata]